MALLSRRRIIDHDPLDLLKVSSVQDKRGNWFFRVSYSDDNSEHCCAYFKSMSSVLDFVDSNFRDLNV